MSPTNKQKEVVAVSDLFDIYDAFATDLQAEVEGVWVPLGSKGARIRVARAGNDRYQKRMTEVLEQYADKLNADTPEARALDEQLTRRVQAETILTGFENISLQGVAQEYSVTSAMRCLEIKDFRRRVILESQRFENYKIKREAAEVKD